MAATPDARSLVKSLFPGHDSLVDRSYREVGSFHDLCQDYRNCAVVLERWRGRSDGESAARVQEYSELLAELTEELEDWLAERTGGTPVRRPGGTG